jgi:glycerophosphoryl diester phosphodiesterase
VLAITTIFFLSTASNNPSRLELFNNPSVIIHRGGGIYGPENTLSAIQAGIDSGADAIEFDVRFTSDGVPVLMHDETITRTTNATTSIKVADLTLEQLKEYDAGSYFGEEFIGETVPTLFEALDLINNNANVYIEIKGYHEDAASLISEVIDEVGFNGEIKFISFNETLLEEMKLFNEDAETVLLLGSFFGDIEVLSSKDYIDHYGFQYQVVEARGEYIQSLQQAGKGVVVWTVNDEINITQMNKLGVDGIITDNPLLAREIIYSSMTKSTYSQLLERLFTREEN